MTTTRDGTRGRGGPHDDGQEVPHQEVPQQEVPHDEIPHHEIPRQDRAEHDEATAETPWECLRSWTEEERAWWWMGPFAGQVPGMVRRVRRILDVSQRGLAALLGVSQSVVARWETGRTSPRVSVLEQLLRLAGLVATIHDRETGEEVGAMRADGARTRGGSRFPAHVDLRATGWWVPRALRTMTSVEAYAWVRRSREAQDPAVRYRLGPHWKRIERLLHGTPDDHPALHQMVAEVVHLDERREERRRAVREWPNPAS